ncbi:unnamed protein product [Rangifer tarandus platyrhynchus]|uniref:Uncharacterized protein n=1 Tax=Rangifer tarandus platyrhynchus TaxID=3082113 RepID=A0AC59ZWE4_RANTA
MNGSLEGFKEEAFSLMKEAKGLPGRASARSKLHCEEQRRHLIGRRTGNNGGGGSTARQVEAAAEEEGRDRVGGELGGAPSAQVVALRPTDARGCQHPPPQPPGPIRGFRCRDGLS